MFLGISSAPTSVAFNPNSNAIGPILFNSGLWVGVAALALFAVNAPHFSTRLLPSLSSPCAVLRHFGSHGHPRPPAPPPKTDANPFTPLTIVEAALNPLPIRSLRLSRPIPPPPSKSFIAPAWPTSPRAVVASTGKDPKPAGVFTIASRLLRDPNSFGMSPRLPSVNPVANAPSSCGDTIPLPAALLIVPLTAPSRPPPAAEFKMFPKLAGYFDVNRSFAILITGPAYLLTSGGNWSRPIATAASTAPPIPLPINAVITDTARGSSDSNALCRPVRPIWSNAASIFPSAVPFTKISTVFPTAVNACRVSSDNSPSRFRSSAIIRVIDSRGRPVRLRRLSLASRFSACAPSKAVSGTRPASFSNSLSSGSVPVNGTNLIVSSNAISIMSAVSCQRSFTLN